jgi:hypothetical protein
MRWPLRLREMPSSGLKGLYSGTSVLVAGAGAAALKAQVITGLVGATWSEATVELEGVRRIADSAKRALLGNGLSSKPGGRVGAGRRVGSPGNML